MKAMIEITFEKDDAILKFPKQLIASDYVQEFLERLRLEEIAEKSEISDQQTWELSEQLKKEWWQKNKEKFLKKD
ncbi:hypothetical protein JW960_20945 [candidate division KSB1 bacterium]|nr:hypothetical protein [candidate division KSB1 bacterium]